MKPFLVVSAGARDTTKGTSFRCDELQFFCGLHTTTRWQRSDYFSRYLYCLFNRRFLMVPTFFQTCFFCGNWLVPMLKMPPVKKTKQHFLSFSVQSQILKSKSVSLNHLSSGPPSKGSTATLSPSDRTDRCNWWLMM